MDASQARRILGVEVQAPPEEVRAAFRRRLRRAHPDVDPGHADAGRRTAVLVEAYATLRRVPPLAEAAVPPVPAGEHRHRPSGRRVDVDSDGDRIHVVGPADEVYRRLVEVAHGIGEITYLEPESLLLDTIVVSDDGAACSLLASLHRRATGTEIFFTLEPLGGEKGPPVEPLVTAIAAALAAPG